MTSSARKDSDNQQHPCLTDPVSSLGTAFLMDMPGSILTKSQSTGIINYVRENENCKFTELESAILRMQLVLWEKIGNAAQGTLLLCTEQSGQHLNVALQ